MSEEPHRIVLATLDECMRVGNYRWRLIERVRERAADAGLKADYRTWLARYSEWFNPERRHHIPLYVFDDAAIVYGSSPWLDAWLAQEQRMQRERRVERLPDVAAVGRR